MTFENVDIAAEELAAGMVVVDERLNFDLLVGHVVVGSKWVTARAFHPQANVYPNPPRRFRRGDTVRVRRPVVR